MIKILKNSSAWAFSIITIIFTFVPEKIFGNYKLLTNYTDEVNIIINRFLTFGVILVISFIIHFLYSLFRKVIYIKGTNYSIKIEYGDILNMNGCKKVINFDECFTTSIGSAPSDVNPDSVCGQFLQKYPMQDMQLQINHTQLKPARGKSKYQGKTKYESGRVVRYNDFLLMSFAKLNENGSGEMTRDEFLDCLSILWEEIDKYYGQKDVCIPILGSGVTRMGDESLTQQKLLDIIIASYKLTTHKIKQPCQLHIVCKKSDGFSLNKIGETI